MNAFIRKQIAASIERLGFFPFVAGIWVMILVTLFLVWMLIEPELNNLKYVGSGVLGLVGVVFTFIAKSKANPK